MTLTSTNASVIESRNRNLRDAGGVPEETAIQGPAGVVRRLPPKKRFGRRRAGPVLSPVPACWLSNFLLRSPGEDSGRGEARSAADAESAQLPTRLHLPQARYLSGLGLELASFSPSRRRILAGDAGN